MNTLTDSQLAPGGDITNMIQPSLTISNFGEIGTSVDGWKVDPVPLGFTKGM